MKKTNGFTLIELSISLVIIGIIVAAIASGSVIIKQATIRSVVSDVRAISTAINSFKVQYGTLPGDLSNAQTYWPVVASTPTANLANGNGNGYIDGTENNNVFQMLSLAGLIQYTIANSAYYPSKYSNSANYQISNVGSVYGSAGLGDVLNLANYSSSSYYGAVKPQDAYDIDNKMEMSY